MDFLCNQLWPSNVSSGHGETDKQLVYCNQDELLYKCNEMQQIPKKQTNKKAIIKKVTWSAFSQIVLHQMQFTKELPNIQLSKISALTVQYVLNAMGYRVESFVSLFAKITTRTEQKIHTVFKLKNGKDKVMFQLNPLKPELILKLWRRA